MARAEGNKWRKNKQAKQQLNKSKHLRIPYDLQSFTFLYLFFLHLYTTVYCFTGQKLCFLISYANFLANLYVLTSQSAVLFLQSWCCKKEITTLEGTDQKNKFSSKKKNVSNSKSSYQVHLPRMSSWFLTSSPS